MQSNTKTTKASLKSLAASAPTVLKAMGVEQMLLY